MSRSAINNADEQGGEDALIEQLNEMGDVIARHLRDPALLGEIKQVRDNFRTEKLPAGLPGDIFPGSKKS